MGGECVVNLNQPFCGEAAMSEPAVSLVLGRLGPEERDEGARLIHAALAAWYGRHLNQPERFGTAWEPFRVFPEVYEALDPGGALTARDAGTGQLLGLCFYHERPTHVSVGIVATSPEAGGRGVGRAMVEEVLALADAAGLPVRLVSSLMNLDSFSLYTRLGFVPGTVFQDLQFPPGVVPEPVGLEGGSLGEAAAGDVAAMAALEGELTGLDRVKDLNYLVSQASGSWRTLVLRGPGGELRGYLGSFQSGATQMLGPGLMRDEGAALALLVAQLRAQAPGNPVFLVPARASGLVAALYAAGARNVELHVAQVRGPGREPGGVVIPTFLPESG